MGDVCWSTTLYLQAFTYVLSDIDADEQAWREFFYYSATAAVVLPMMLQTVFIAKLIKKASRLGWLETDRLTQYSTITVILLSFTDPDAVMLLPFDPECYKLKGSPFPNKSALVSA